MSRAPALAAVAAAAAAAAATAAAAPPYLCPAGVDCAVLNSCMYPRQTPPNKSP